MAKKFMGFTLDQTHKLLSGLGYSGPAQQKEMQEFIQAQPGVAARMGKYLEAAHKRFEPAMGMAEGGAVPDSATAERGAEDYSRETNFFTNSPFHENLRGKFSTTVSGDRGGSVLDRLDAARAVAAGNPTNPNALAQLDKENRRVAIMTPGSADTTLRIMETPERVVEKSNVAKIPENNNQFIDQNTGKLTGDPKAEVSTAQAQEAQAKGDQTTSTMQATQVGDEVNQTLDGMQAATAEPSKKATVQGQMEDLLSDFADGTPPWAAPAMRAATSAMQARGLGASSMAGQAVVQAAMEAALPIATQDARTFAEFEMQNLNNEQQTLIFKNQQKMASLFTDQAADNAAKQFNAASENQTKQFFADLETTVSRFNAEQVNAIREFNAGQENATSQFNARMADLREQFNATNSLVIAQANTQWRQQIATTDTAAQNQSNFEYAKQINGFTQKAVDQIWQRERDLMSFAFTSAEAKYDRDLQILLANKDIAQTNRQMQSQERQAQGYLAARILLGGGIF